MASLVPRPFSYEQPGYEAREWLASLYIKLDLLSISENMHLHLSLAHAYTKDTLFT